MLHQPCDREIQGAGQHDLPLPDLLTLGDQFRRTRERSQASVPLQTVRPKNTEVGPAKNLRNFGKKPR